MPHLDFGEGVVAFVVRSGDADMFEKDLIGALKLRLANFKVPKRVFFVDALPRNVIGKVQKILLREAHAGLFLEPKS